MPDDLQLPQQVWNLAFSVKPVVQAVSVMQLVSRWCRCDGWFFFFFWCLVTATLSLSLPPFCFLQGPPLGQRAGQTNQAKEGELPPERGSPLSRNQRGAGPHHWLLSLQTRNRSDFLSSFFLTLSYFVRKILSPVKTMNSNEKHVWVPPDELTVSCDISKDEELFMGHGDYQFDIYRLMRQENGSVHLYVAAKIRKS